MSNKEQISTQSCISSFTHKDPALLGISGPGPTPEGVSEVNPPKPAGHLRPPTLGAVLSPSCVRAGLALGIFWHLDFPSGICFPEESCA